MLIDLSKVISCSGFELEEELCPDLCNFNVGGTDYKVLSSDLFRLKVTNKGRGKLMIEGQVTLSVGIPCARCLRSVSYPFSLDIVRSVDTTLSEEEREASEDEYNFIRKEQLDVNRLMINELVVQWPIRVLCREDCKGICNRCGADLNLGECGCDRSSADPRMAAIQDIFSKFKEV